MNLSVIQIERLRKNVAELDVKKPIPSNVLSVLRRRFGMRAEHYASLLAMSDVDFRLYLERNRHENALDLADLRSDLKQLDEVFHRHHHHFLSPEVCTRIHW